MKTIAITIDEPTLKRLDQLVTDTGFSFRNRSDVIRRAVQQFLERVQREAEERRETEIFRKHKSRLNRQAVALIKEQARP
jgi:Arc/MetJ-type ribon-helix-helix transcriptional regulator